MNDAPAPFDPIPVGQPPSEEDRQLAAFFQQLEHEQLTFLDEAGKRIAELCTALLGVLFAVLALGGTFPPPLLAALPRARAARVGRVGSALSGPARRYLGHPPAQLPALPPQPHPNAARTGAHGRLQSALGGGGRHALCTGLSGAGRPGGDGDLGSVVPRRFCFGVYYERDQGWTPEDIVHENKGFYVRTLGA